MVGLCGRRDLIRAGMLVANRTSLLCVGKIVKRHS